MLGFSVWGVVFLDVGFSCFWELGSRFYVLEFRVLQDVGVCVQEGGCFRV